MNCIVVPPGVIGARRGAGGRLDLGQRPQHRAGQWDRGRVIGQPQAGTNGTRTVARCGSGRPSLTTARTATSPPCRESERGEVACARISRPAQLARNLGLEARDYLQRMLASIPLTDDERAAVDDGQAALESLLARLADVPTPAGATPARSASRVGVMWLFC